MHKNKNKLHNIPRFYLPDGLSIIYALEQIHQITRVLRLTEGDQMIGIFGGSEFLLEISSIENKQIFLTLLKELPESRNEFSFYLKIYLPLLKGDKNELVLQKCTELGAHEFQFVEFERSVKQNINWSHKLERWQKVVIEAIEQSERVKLPIIKESIELKKITLKEEEKGIVFVERCSSSSLLHSKTDFKQISLIFGPEGGFTEEEKQFINQQGFEKQSLGPRILRAETAIIVGCYQSQIFDECSL